MVQAAFGDESHLVSKSILKNLLTDLMDPFIATISLALGWLQLRSMAKVIDILPVTWKPRTVFFGRSVFIYISAITIITIIMIITFIIVTAIIINIDYFINVQGCIMNPSFLRVDQYLIGIINKRKNSVCIIIAQFKGLRIRMVCFGKISVRSLDLRLSSICRDTQYLVEVL